MGAVAPEELFKAEAIKPETEKVPGIINDSLAINDATKIDFFLHTFIQKHINGKTSGVLPSYSTIDSLTPTSKPQSGSDTPQLSLLGQDAVRRHPYLIDLIIDQKIKPVVGENGKKLSDISKLEIDHKGQLILSFKNDQIKLIIDMSTKVIESSIIQNQSSLDRRELQLKGEKKYLYGGLVAAIGLYDSFGKTFIVKKLEIHIAGNPKIIEIGSRFYSNGDIDTQEVLRILEKRGIEINPKTGRFIDLNAIRLRAMGYRESITKIQKYTFEDFQKDQKALGIEGDITSEEFERDKAKTMEILGDLNKTHSELKYKSDFRSFVKTPYAMTKFIGKGVGICLIPMFSEHIKKNSQDAGAYAYSMVENLMFIGGAWVTVQGGAKGGAKGGAWVAAKTGGKLGGKMPGPGKVAFTVIGSIVGGGAAIFGGEEWLKSIEIGRRSTKNFPNREDLLERTGWGDGNKEFIAHAGFSWLMEDIVDGYSHLFGTDLNLIFYKTKIGLDTNPREYLLSRSPVFRQTNESVDQDTEFWNQRVDKLQENFIVDLKKIIGSEKSKEKIKKNIHKLIYPDGIRNNFNPTHLRVQVNIETYINDNYDEIISGKDKVLYDYVAFQINKLKINSEYIKVAREGNQDGKRYMNRAISGDANSPYEDMRYISHLPERERAFVNALFHRVVSIEPILRDDSVWEGEKMDEEVLWKNLMGDTYFFAGELSAEEKQMLVDIFPGNKEELRNILDNNPIINTDNYSGEIREFLLGINQGASLRSLTQKMIISPRGDMRWQNTEHTRKFDTIAKQEGNNKIIEGMREKTHGGNHFYQFFTRMIEYKRKEKFMDSIEETGQATGRNMRGNKMNL